MTGARVFDFDPPVPFWEVMRAIVAALADEGLRLNDSNAPDHVRTVIVDGRKLAIVPLSRIAERIDQ